MLHVNDSTAYLLRGGKLEHVNWDSKLLDLLENKNLIAKEEANKYRRSPIPVEAPFPGSEPSISIGKLRKNDILLLCSRDMARSVPMAEIEDAVRKSANAGQAEMTIRSAARIAGVRESAEIAFYAQGVWNPNPIVKVKSKGQPQAGTPRRTLKMVFGLGLILAALLWVVAMASGPGSKSDAADEPLMRPEGIPAGLSENGKGKNNIIQLSTIAGPHNIVQGRSGVFNVVASGDSEYKYKWYCSPLSAGSFSDPSSSNPEFRLNNVKPGQKVMLWVSVTGKSQDLALRNFTLTVDPVRKAKNKKSIKGKTAKDNSGGDSAEVENSGTSGEENSGGETSGGEAGGSGGDTGGNDGGEGGENGHGGGWKWWGK